MHDALAACGRIGNVVLIDRATRATADLLELYLDAALAAEWLGRPPDVVDLPVVSWGGVHPDQVTQLLDLCGDTEGLQLWQELRATHAARGGFIALSWRAKE